MKVELTATNVVALQCVAEYLEMTNEFGDGNLICENISFSLASGPSELARLCANL